MSGCCGGGSTDKPKDGPQVVSSDPKQGAPKAAGNSATGDMMMKLLLLGDSGVGKTCLLLRFADDVFNDTFISTIGIDFKHKNIDIDGRKIKLQIWDTAGQEKYRTITSAYYRSAQGILLCYDVTDEKSFNNVANWVRNIDEHANASVNRVLVGNKCDMPEKRVISTERGKALAAKYGIKFFETSARANQGVTEAFMALTKDVKDRLSAP